jgi:hypothetical protein
MGHEFKSNAGPSPLAMIGTLPYLGPGRAHAGSDTPSTYCENAVEGTGFAEGGGAGSNPVGVPRSEGAPTSGTAGRVLFYLVRLSPAETG